jgi:vancomycin permeability regulator SanA
MSVQENSERNEKKPMWICVGSVFSRIFIRLKACPWKKVLLYGWKRRLPTLCLLLGIVVALIGSICILGAAICDKTSERIVTAEALKTMEGDFDCVLVLGCKAYPDGTLSARLADRMEIGIALSLDGIGDALLLSGDRQDDGSYDEVSAMRAAAISAGVKENTILCDGRGYSTYESLVRAKEIFDAERIVIVTQEYHLYRALYIAEQLGIEAYGVNADLRPYSDRLRCEVREIFARVKDLFWAQAMPTVDLRYP